MSEDLNTQKADQPIYLDNHASTPVDERVFAEMEPYFTDIAGNPANDIHESGHQAAKGVSEATERIVEAIGGTREKSIIYTSGATESDNLALRGPIRYARDNNVDDGHIITTQIEHEAILETARYLEGKGIDVTYLPVDEYGRVDPSDVSDAIREDTIIISVMMANNEIGTIQPIKEIGKIADQNDVIFHTDAVQAVGFEDIDVNELNIDMMSISGHKIYGPKGIGALYLKWPDAKNRIEPILFGGGHQGNLRSGTLNVPGIVGLGRAIELAEEERRDRVARIRDLRDDLWERFQDSLDNIELNGHPEHRLPNNLNVSFPGVNNYRLVTKLSKEWGVHVAAGSACSTNDSNEPVVKTSHVLESITSDPDRLDSAVRFGLGKDTQEQEIQKVGNAVVKEVSRVHSMF